MVKKNTIIRWVSSMGYLSKSEKVSCSSRSSNDNHKIDDIPHFPSFLSIFYGQLPNQIDKVVSCEFISTEHRHTEKQGSRKKLIKSVFLSLHSKCLHFSSSSRGPCDLMHLNAISNHSTSTACILPCAMQQKK